MIGRLFPKRKQLAKMMICFGFLTMERSLSWTVPFWPNSTSSPIKWRLAGWLGSKSFATLQLAASDQIASMKNLTTKFVRTWRSKKRNGVSMWYRRARLCAREFRWLDDSKEGLFSPATSTDIVRMIPALYLAWKEMKPDQKFAIISLDVKDAYLEVAQPVPVVSTIQGKSYVFERMVPGQREGSQQWFNHFVAYLSEHFHVEKCKECPAVVRLSSKSADGSAGESQGPGMIHVDDSLLLLPLDWALKCFIPVIQQRFQITYEVTHEPGDSFRFLKSLHSITDQGITIRQPSSYIQQMQTIMNVKQSSRQRVPCWPELRSKDNTPELSIEEVYSDADWSGSKKDRRSYGGASYCLNGRYIHYICRSQKSVSLSSMESEYYCAVGASCQGIFMKAVIEFMSRSPCDLTVYVDNQACKAFCLRQGVTKAASISRVDSFGFKMSFRERCCR
ncbi:RXLR161 [Symbiodinium sp. KB8]|nr:RXLR161 [Symbiodinium sp. KB8]